MDNSDNNYINIIFTDLDGTLKYTSGIHTIFNLLKNIRINIFYKIRIILRLILYFPYILYLYLIYNKYEIEKIGLSLIFKNLNKNDINKSLVNIDKYINHNILNIINSYKSEYKYIISGTPNNIINMKTKLLEQFKFYGSELFLNSDNQTYNGKSNICYGNSKVIIINKILSELKLNKKLNIIIFGNDIGDYEMLSIANTAYLVNPTKELKNIFKLNYVLI